MKTENKQLRESREASGICANEGCGRPAEGKWCDACGLERSLFHREERSAAGRPRPESDEPGPSLD